MKPGSKSNALALVPTAQAAKAGSTKSKGTVVQASPLKPANKVATLQTESRIKYSEFVNLWAFAMALGLA